MFCIILDLFLVVVQITILFNIDLIFTLLQLLDLS